MIFFKNIDIGISGPVRNPNRGVDFQHPKKMTGT